MKRWLPVLILLPILLLCACKSSSPSDCEESADHVPMLARINIGF